MKVIFLIFGLSIYSNVFAAQEWWGIYGGTCVAGSSIRSPSPTAIVEESPDKCTFKALDKEMGVYVLTCLTEPGGPGAWKLEMKKLFSKTQKGCNFAKGKKDYRDLDGAQKTIKD